MKPTTSKAKPAPPVDPQLPRAAYLILYDFETDSCEIVPNSEALTGARLQAPETVTKRGPQVLITGYFGPKALQTLAAAGIEVVVDAKPHTVRKRRRLKS